MAKKIASVDREICVACGACAKECPKQAIGVYKGCYAVVKASDCVGCGRCARACPAGCITIRERGADE